MRMDGVVDLFPMPGAPPLALEKWPADNHNLGGGGSNAGHPSAVAQGRLSQEA